MSRVEESQSGKELEPTGPRQLIPTGPRELPDDLTCNIISRIPPKEVCYFKTLSRKWNQRLSETSFKEMYQERSKTNPKLLIACISQNEERDQKGEIIKEFFLRLSLLDMKEKEGTVHYENFTRKIKAHTRMMCAANGGGLACFANHEEFFIFNPISKKFANLPKISSTTYTDLSKAGFGYIPSSNEYIFVHIFDVSQEEDEDEDFRCEWLTLSEVNQHEDIRTSLSWKVLETPSPFLAKKSGVLVDGLFYFCISDHCHHTAKQVIFSVDLKTENFKIIGHPDETLYIGRNKRFVVELNGQLCFGDIFVGSAEMDLWLLTNAGKTDWMKLCRVDLSRLDGFDERLLDQITLIGLRNGELIIQSLRNDKLEYYNIEKETSREGNVSVPTWSQICLYSESLSFLNIRSS